MVLASAATIPAVGELFAQQTVESAAARVFLMEVSPVLERGVKVKVGRAPGVAAGVIQR